MQAGMIQIGDVIVSRDLLDEHFFCHLEECEGSCCVYGDAGAPLEEQETLLLEKHLDQIKPYLRAEGVRAVSQQGAWVIDGEGEKVTPLVGLEECAYAVFDEGIARCAIEQAYEAEGHTLQKTGFLPPVSHQGEQTETGHGLKLPPLEHL
jgi:hypothetical protein